jgi:protein phosphatase 2C family protein 2/3
VTASRSYGGIKSYAANSHVGLVRQSNEDRITINYLVAKPSYKECEHWPPISYFGVFDGHGGSACAEFLRDHLLDYILNEASFPDHPVDAIKSGFARADADFMANSKATTGMYDRSGSCANVAIIIRDACYVANVGDSRAVLSCDRGARLHELSQDHKPNLPLERERIEKHGGKVYTNEVSAVTQHSSGEAPVYRVYPGRLAISRAFGDASAKLESLGGTRGVVIAVPEIKSFRISKKYDFILIASDGVFDKLSSSDVIRTVWSAFDSSTLQFHEACGQSVKKVLEEALVRRSLDNVSAVLIAFKPMLQTFQETSSD